MLTDHKLSVFESIGKLSDDGVFIYHMAEQRFQYCNNGLFRLLEITEEALMDNAADVINKVAPDDINYLYTKYFELLEQNRLSDVECRLVVNEGIIKYVKFDGYVLADDGVIIGFIKDISKQKESKIM